MKRQSAVLSALIIILGGILFVLVPGRDGTQSADLNKPGDIALAVQERMAGVASYRYNTTVQVGSLVSLAADTGVVGRLSGGLNNGSAQQAGQRFMSLEWHLGRSSGQTSVYMAWQPREKNGPEPEALVYIRHPVKNKWVPPDEEPTVGPYLDFFWGQLGLLDPMENILRLNPEEQNINVRDEDQWKVALEVEPNPAGLFDITKSMPPQLAGAELADVRQIYWVSKENLLVNQYEVRAKVKFFGLGDMDYLAVSKVQDYDRTEIKLPKELLERLKKT